MWLDATCAQKVVFTPPRKKSETTRNNKQGENKRLTQNGWGTNGEKGECYIINSDGEEGEGIRFLMGSREESSRLHMPHICPPGTYTREMCGRGVPWGGNITKNPKGLQPDL